MSTLRMILEADDWPLFPVIELDASGPKEVQKTIAEMHTYEYRLTHMAVCMDTDGARFYTLAFEVIE